MSEEVSEQLWCLAAYQVNPQQYGIAKSKNTDTSNKHKLYSYKRAQFFFHLIMGKKNPFFSPHIKSQPNLKKKNLNYMSEEIEINTCSFTHLPKKSYMFSFKN